MLIAGRKGRLRKCVFLEHGLRLFKGWFLAATRIFQYTGVSPLIEFGTASVKSLFTTRPRWLSRNMIEYGAGLCGMACLISPLLLWVSWSQEALKGILIFAFGALFITLWLTQFWGEE